MSDFLRQRMTATPAMITIWDDRSTLRHALAFEGALAECQAAQGIIPVRAAQQIIAAVRSMPVDPAALAEEVAHAGTLAIPLVRRLREAVGEGAAEHVHRGATSQDLADTVLALQLCGSGALLHADVIRMTSALAPLAHRYAALPAVGRTLLQDALPIGLGLRFAQWHAGIASAARQLRAAISRGARVQLGGPVGTRAGLGPVADRVAERLGLPCAAPWHARRGGTAAIGAALGILIGTVGKMARDISLLAQPAIGEVHEPAIAGRGGSSAMAHKRNPTGCQAALAATARAPGMVAAVIAAMPGEEERGLGGWPAEASLLADLCLIASGALAAMATVAEGLEIDEAAVARNLAVAGIGDDVGDSAALVAQLLAEDS